jgi:hypothetical protein
LKRRIVLGVVLLATLVVSTGALAAPVREQLEALTVIQDKMRELRKEMISLQLEAGLISRDLARHMTARMRTPALGNLTSEQKQALKELQERCREFRREELKKLVEDGVFTEEQAKRLAAVGRVARNRGQLTGLPWRRGIAPRRALPGGMLRRFHHRTLSPKTQED